MKASDYNIERDIFLSIPSGRVPYSSSVNKFGYAPDGVQTTATDIWDRADAAATQQLWQPPIISVEHNIVSTHIADTSAGGGGTHKVQIYGLTDYDTDEISEIVEMNGTTNVLTSNKYIIIHRMKVIEHGATSPNTGVITAKSNDPFTYVAAQINVNEGQTQMAIYGIPSTKTAYLVDWYVSIHNRTSATATIKLLWAPFPSVTLPRFITKETRGLCSDGSSSETWEKKPYTKFKGPGILKIQATASAADQDMGGGFDLILLDN